jgi:hypothetical protein
MQFAKRLGTCLKTGARWGSTAHGNEPGGLFLGLKVWKRFYYRAEDDFMDGRRYGLSVFMVHSWFMDFWSIIHQKLGTFSSNQVLPPEPELKRTDA